MSIPRTAKRRTSKNRNALLEALSRLELLSNLVEKTDAHYTHELDLEIIVYGRTYAGGPVGPYARLWVYELGAEVISEGDWAGNCFYVLVDGELELRLDKGREFARKLRQGELFGEMAVIEGDARSTTVVVREGGQATVIELQRPALRLLRELPNFARIFDAEYRRHSLQVTLDTVQHASNFAFDEELLAELCEIAQFKVYRKHHVLLREGQPIASIYFINKGWVEVRRGGVDDDASDAEDSALAPDKSLSSSPGASSALEPDAHLLGPGNCVGLEVFKGQSCCVHTLVMQGRTEVLEIPVEKLRARWLTGYVGLAAVIGAMLYLTRKQVYKRRRGPLRYWRLAHVYLGSSALVVLLVHGGWRSGGLLTSALMVAFDLTILSGAAGALIYLLAPRLLTKIEGEPLLLDNLLARRDELRDDLSRLGTSDEQLSELLKREIPRRLLSLRGPLRQYTEQAELKALLEEARREFAGDADRLQLSAESRGVAGTLSFNTADTELAQRHRELRVIQASVLSV